MNNTPGRWATDEDFADHVVDLLQTMPEEHPVSYHQNSFATVLNAGRTITENVIKEHTDSWDSLTVRDADLVLNAVWRQAMLTGVSVYASLTRSFDAPPRCAFQINYDDAWLGVHDRMTPETDDAVIFHAVLHRYGPIHAARKLIALNILADVVHLPFVKGHKETFWELVCLNFMHGLALEAAYVHCMAETRQYNEVIRNLIQDRLPVPMDPDDPDFIKNVQRALSDTVSDCPNIHPWPRDEICTCGCSLKPFIFCCDPHSPIDMSAYEGQLTPGFEIHRDCCGVSLPGFKCDVCGSVYTWDKGVVDSVG